MTYTFCFLDKMCVIRAIRQYRPSLNASAKVLHTYVCNRSDPGTWKESG